MAVDLDFQAVNTELYCSCPNPGCPDPECLACAALDCPWGEPLHYHHDGCPACDGAVEPKEGMDEP